MSIYNDPPPGMCIVPDKDNLTKVGNRWQDKTTTLNEAACAFVKTSPY